MGFLDREQKDWLVWKEIVSCSKNVFAASEMESDRCFLIEKPFDVCRKNEIGRSDFIQCQTLQFEKIFECVCDLNHSPMRMMVETK